MQSKIGFLQEEVLKYLGKFTKLNKQPLKWEQSQHVQYNPMDISSYIIKKVNLIVSIFKTVIIRDMKKGK